MKTTLEVPDDLYALVKAKAALEGRTLRAVMEELLKGWVGGGSEERGARSGERGGTEGQGLGGSGVEGERGARGGGREVGVVAEGARESYGGTKGDERGPMRTKEDEKGGSGKRGTRSETAVKIYPWDVLRLKWEREHNPQAPIDQIAGTLKGAGPDLDMAQAREAYMRDIADEWRRREAKGARERGEAGGAGNAEGNGSRET